jgi:hypothetical protein
MDTQRTRRHSSPVRKALGVLCTVVVLCLISTPLSAQFRRPRAELTPLLEGTAKAGAPVRAALKVVLPEGLHTQSNKPRDPNLIPTELTIDAPAGVTVDEIVWPKPTDFKVEGLDDLLAVFEHESIIGVQLTLASSVPNGALKVPAHFRYQACDSKACYAPTHGRSGGGRRSGQRHRVQGDSVRQWFAGFGNLTRFGGFRRFTGFRGFRGFARVRRFAGIGRTARWL